MQKIIHRSADRGQVDFGWLKSRHSFSFGQYYDAQKINFGALRVLNDDQVAPGQGFGRHPHDNMEIVSIPLAGTLAHGDNMGNGKDILTGDVQIMSAGTGIAHSEYNGSKTEDVHFLQIWVLPKDLNIEPRYDQKSYRHLDKNNKWVTVVSPDQEDQSAVWINQDAWFNLADLSTGANLSYSLHGDANGIYLFVLEGTVSIAGEQLERRDAIGLYEIDTIDIEASRDAKVLLIEVPMY
ncbi:pirin family protein [Sphingobacterium sp. SYP-B4668]|uniref:pirin family protein n=1 Tax=Sphingobacterium sp. SYP-B4668 TaxID=2996035 RepID=UPI0022DD9F3E|nr:pirin family protein [Sphingobacterium sp. SYP-B4668]